MNNRFLKNLTMFRACLFSMFMMIWSFTYSEQVKTVTTPVSKHTTTYYPDKRTFIDDVNRQREAQKCLADCNSYKTVETEVSIKAFGFGYKNILPKERTLSSHESFDITQPYNGGSSGGGSSGGGSSGGASICNEFFPSSSIACNLRFN